MSLFRARITNTVVLFCILVVGAWTLSQAAFAQTSRPATRKAQVVQSKKAGQMLAPPARRAVPKANAVKKLPEASGGSQDFFEKVFLQKVWSKGPLMALLLLFLFGIGTSLTPCVYPMIPITIAVLGNSAAKEGGKPFLLSVTYVLGMAIVYTGLGLLVAFPMGFLGDKTQMSGFMMQSPLFNGFLVFLFFAMSLSMFGLFDMNLPSSWQTKLASVQGQGFLGVFVLGMVGGVLATPCSGPILIGLLAFITKVGNPWLGAGLLFVFSLGIGVPFLLLGSGVVKALPRSGRWMNEVKKVFGVLLLGAALYYVQFLFAKDSELFALTTAGVLLFFGIFAGAFRVYDESDSAWLRWRQIFGIVCLIGSMYLFVGFVAKKGFIQAPLSELNGSSKLEKQLRRQLSVQKRMLGTMETLIEQNKKLQTLSFRQARSLHQMGTLLTRGSFRTSKPSKLSEAERAAQVKQQKETKRVALLKNQEEAQKAELKAARKACLPPVDHPEDKPFWFTSEKKAIACAKLLKRPVVLDFWAEWCAVCKKLEKVSFNHADVVREGRRFVMVKIEYSEETKEGLRLKKKYASNGRLGLPWVRFVGSDAKINPMISVGMKSPKELLKLLKSIK